MIPKCLVGTAKIGFHVHFGELKRAFWPKGAFTSPRGAHFELLYSSFGLSFSIPQLGHYSQCIFDMQSLSHSSHNELCCPHLVSQASEHYVCFNVHHSLFTINDFLLHFGLWSLFSKFPLIRVGNTRMYNESMAKPLSPIN